MKLVQFEREGHPPVYINPEMVVSVHALDRTDRKTTINLSASGGQHNTAHIVTGSASEVVAALQA